MKRNLSVIFALALVIGANTLSAMAESDASTLAPVTNFFSDYNNNDIAKASILFLEELSVTDAFPPVYWQGRNAFKDWMADLETFNTKNKYTDYDFKVGKPLAQEVDADRANVIVPLVLDLKHGGKPVDSVATRYKIGEPGRLLAYGTVRVVTPVPLTQPKTRAPVASRANVAPLKSNVKVPVAPRYFPVPPVTTPVSVMVEMNGKGGVGNVEKS
jgi:hypothetical protein